MKSDKLNHKIIEEITHLANSFAQDLAFLALSAPLDHLALKQSHKFELEAELASIKLLLEQAKNLPNKSEYDRLPLGKYAESLLHFYFLHHPDWELLAENMQLNQEGISRGEIDFLLYHHKQKQYIHLELALKYYLKTDLGKGATFLGPSTKDWFLRKIEKLQEHQLKLSKTYPQLLGNAWSQLEFEPKHLIKGALFHHWREVLPIQENALFSKAWWCHVEDYEKLPHSPYAKLILDKKDWLFPFKAENLLPHHLVIDNINLLFAEGRNELMVVRYNQEDHVLDRGFIVRTNWPN